MNIFTRKPMKDREIIKRLSSRLNWKKHEVEAMLAAFIEITGKQLGNNDTISFHGLGQFEAGKESAKISVNPADGKHYIIPPRLTAVFKPAPILESYIKTLNNHE